MSQAKGFLCRSCQSLRPEEPFICQCPDCGQPLEIAYRQEQLKKILERGWPQPSGQSLLRQWLEFLPIDQPDLIERVSLGEAQTPLIGSSRLGRKIGVPDLRFKLEMGPSLSLKDRGTSLCALKAIELGFEAMCVASSGNNAASVAAYAAKAGLPALLFIQKDTSPAKMMKMAAYGARVVRLDGDMSVASRVCAQMIQRRRWMDCGGPNPYRLTAKRTMAYELIGQLGGQIPDAVVLPVGGSTGIVAAYLGFQELFLMGLTPAMPRLIGVQLAACDPVTQAFVEGRKDVTPVAKRPSFSDALMNNSPYWGVRALEAARETKGIFVSVSDEEVAAMIRALGAEEGIFVEPAGAVSMAGLAKIISAGRAERLNRVVCTITGHGLNAPQAAFGTEAVPEMVAPDPAAVEAYLRL